MNQVDKKIEWIPLFTRSGYPLFILDIAMHSYLYEMKHVVGWCYTNQLYIYKDGITRTFISKKDQESFIGFINTLSFEDIENKIIQAENIIRNVSDNLEKIWFELEKKNLNINSIQLLEQLSNNYTKAYSVIRLPALVELSSNFLETELLDRVIQFKDKSAYFYLTHEINLNFFLEKILTKELDCTVNTIRLLTKDEMLESLSLGRIALSKDELKDRMSQLLMVNTGSLVELYSGVRADRILEEHFFVENVVRENSLYGACAQKGETKGIVKIVYVAEDLAYLEEEIILVTPMTTVNYTQYLNSKIKAIITDEGGITCHAGIIARELGIPCVTGTKNATKILKDGDLVEVDATNGIIKKI